MENPVCWSSVQSLKDMDDLSDFMLACDFNTIRRSVEQKVGFFPVTHPEKKWKS